MFASIVEVSARAKALPHEGAAALVNCIYNSMVTNRPYTATLKSIKGTACGIWLGSQLQSPLPWVLDAKKCIFAPNLMCCG